MNGQKEKKISKNEKLNKETLKGQKKKQSKKTSQTTKRQSTVNQWIPKTEMEILLTILFLVLLIAVIILGIKVANLKKEQNNKKDVDLVIPILETKANDSFSVDLSEMKNQDIKEYKFMITNYKDDKIATEDINYKIELTNTNEDISVKLYKNGAENNLLTDDTLSTHNIENNQLSKDEKSTDTYYLIIRMKEEVKEKENIKIKITAIN